MKTGTLERLARDHAYWADKVQGLKRATSELMFDGTSCPHDGETCIDHAFRECGEMNREATPYDGFTFEEVWFELQAGGKVCDTCQEIRRLKAERMVASKRLGAVRAAITRVGRGLTKQEERRHADDQ